jgi:hypothetical protein
MPFFSSKVEKRLLDELACIDQKYANFFSFNIIKDILIKAIKKDPQKIMDFIDSFNGERTIEEWVHSQVGNIVGNYLESGNYHVYRGLLDMTGQDLLKVYDKSCDYLLEMKAKDIDSKYIEEQKRVLRNNIKNVG